MGNTWQRSTRIWLQTATFVLLFTVAAGAQFGTGLGQSWTDFTAPDDRFALSIPPGWSYQADQSTPEFHVFYGPGEYDLFYIELLPSTGLATPASLAQDAIARYSGPLGLPDFRVISQPSAGMLAGQDASFIVYSYTDSGASIHEGRAFVLTGDTVFTLAFADAAAKFDASIPTFNAVMASLSLAQPTVSTGGFGVGISPGTQATDAGQVTHQPAHTAPGTYVSPGEFYRFRIPQAWELWEEQWTAQGDTIEPWNGVFDWGNRPMTKSLFIWDYFDEWEQTGAQYEIVLGVIENVPGSQSNAIEELKNRVAGDSSHLYTTTTSRIRVGAEPALAVQVVTRPGFVEPWSMGTPWHKSVTFYVFKKGTTLFVWTLPNELTQNEDVIRAIESFEWTAR